MHEPRHPRTAGLAAVLIGLVFVAGCSSSGASVPPTAPPSGPPSIAPTPVPSDGATAGQTRTDAWGIEQVWVPAGTFTMGTDAVTIAALEKAGAPAWVAKEFPSEGSEHEVTLTAGYWIDTYEVTNKAFGAFVDVGGYTTEAYWLRIPPLRGSADLRRQAHRLPGRLAVTAQAG